VIRAPELPKDQAIRRAGCRLGAAARAEIGDDGRRSALDGIGRGQRVVRRAGYDKRNGNQQKEEQSENLHQRASGM
jgi:hypothetical protein